MTDIFENKPKEEGTPEAKPAEGVSATDTYLALITNEDGTQKYATEEEALKGSVHAQSHIKSLEAELKELRVNADKGVDMEKILEALNNKPENKSGEDADKTKNLTAEDVANQVEQLLDKRTSETNIKDNITTVTNIFKNLYGDKASETMYSRAQDLGFSQDEINSMIATNPKATLKILGVENVKPIVNDPVADGGGHVVDMSGGKPDAKPDTIMGATNSRQLTDSWKESQARTNQRLGVENS